MKKGLVFYTIYLPFLILLFGIGVAFFVNKLNTARKSAERTAINSNIRGMIQCFTLGGYGPPRNRFRGGIAEPDGILVHSNSEAGLGRIGSTIVDKWNIDSVNLGEFEKQIFDFKGTHNWGGNYYINTYYTNVNRGKRVGSEKVRLVLEIYDWDNVGDGKIAIGFGDAHVETFPAPKRKLTLEDMKTILNVHGEGKGLWGD